MPSRHSLCLVVIARDEAARIERLLDSVRPWVDRMLVLDTGSQDNTPALAAACGARVEHFVWCDDFSAARNRALARAGADWHLVLDADEWLVDGGPALRAWAQRAPDVLGTVQLRDSFDDLGQARQASYSLSRLLPGQVRYTGRIHEQPQHALPLLRSPLVVGHDGYQPAALAAKRGRNRRLLAQALAESPVDAYLHYQWGKDCAVYEEHEAAEQGFARCADLLEGPTPWWFDLVTRRLYGLKRLKRHQEGLDFAALQMAACADSPDFFFALGDLLLDWAADEPARAAELLPMIEQAWGQCLTLGERPGQAGAVAGRGSTLAAHNLALVLEGTGRAAQAQILRQSYGAGL